MKISTISRFAVIPALSLAFYAGCSAQPEDSGSPDGSTPDGDGGDLGDDDGIADGGGTTGGGTYTPVEWPAAPVIDAGAPANAAELFGGAAGGAGPCVMEPQDGTMMPRNWLRPRFKLAAAGGETLFEIKLTSDKSDGKTLTIYTTNPAFAMDGGHFAWIGLRGGDQPVKVDVSIRATGASGGPVSSTTSSFLIAPVNAGGTMVYWASSASQDNVANSRLEGFRVGDEATLTALVPLDVAEADMRAEGYALKPNTTTGASPGKTSCIGCHTSTPDGTAAVYNDGWPWSAVAVSIEEGTKGQRATGVTPMGARLLSQPFIGTTTFSKASWDAGKRIAVATQTPWTAGPYDWAPRNLATSADLVWIDLAAEGDPAWGTDASTANPAFVALQGTGWGKIARTGDSRAAANPNWSPDGLTIAYASVAQVAGGHVGGLDPANTQPPDKPVATATEADIFTVPFAEGAGGNATPVAGAAEAGVAEYYPDFSSDGKFLAFNRDANNTGYIYYRPNAEINVIPVGGGSPHRLAANDPPVCSGQVSPGVINSWAKWSPDAIASAGVTYYWVVFSSARKYDEQKDLVKDTWTPAALDARSSQLYVAAVAVAADGTITSYPATYIWNQTKDTSNLTPAWKEFKIPPVPVN
ncbi:MAG TPA: hypothetical protein VLC09_17785 [Polyangiaceae bacterium]|nr:hypothetical protein [Polyangiaceae bacterium]